MKFLDRYFGLIFTITQSVALIGLAIALAITIAQRDRAMVGWQQAQAIAKKSQSACADCQRMLHEQMQMRPGEP